MTWPTLLCLLFVLSASAPLARSFNIQEPSWTDDDVKKQIYAGVKADYQCFKLLDIDGHYGCESQPRTSTHNTHTRTARSHSIQQATLNHKSLASRALTAVVVDCALFALTAPFDGIRGVLRLVDSPDALDRLVDSPPRYHLTAAMHTPMFNRSTINKLRDNTHVAGVVILAGAQPNPAGYSPATRSPQLRPPANPQFASFPPSATLPSSPRFNRSFVWNPLGDDMRSEFYPFAMQLLNEADSAAFESRAEENEAAIAEGWQPVHWAEFRNPSKAFSDSLTCLEEQYCNPIGAQSIWTTLFPLSRNETRPFIMATVAIDSQSMFSATSTGAEAVQSGVIALMAAVDAIGRLLHNNVTRDSVLDDFKYNLLFFFSHAESFDHAGSGKFVDDLLHFECTRPDEDNANACNEPFKPSLHFLHLARNASGGRVGLSRIDRVLEVGQVGLNSSLYLHVERDASSRTRVWGEEIMSLLRNESLITLDWAPTDLPGIPPSVSETFLSVNSSLPVLHIADHKREFLDRYYHSDDDYQLLQGSDESTSAQSTLCALGTLIARSLYVAAGGNDSFVHVIRADCQFVSRLINCLTQNAHCDELRDFMLQSEPSAPSHFPGAYYPTTLDNYVWDLNHPFFSSSVFVRYFNRSLAAAFANTSSLPSYHDAVDPLLQLTDDNYGQWTVTSGNGSRASSRVWALSNFIAHSSRLYRVEDDVVVYGLLLLGLLLSGGSVAGVWLGRKWMTDNFKSV